MIKQLKFKIYRHECQDCGWNIWRDYIIEEPICSTCGSTTPPVITEEELVREMVVYDTYTPEDYEKAKKVAKDIIAGVPLEEIEELELDIDLKANDYSRTEPAIFFRTLAQGSRGAGRSRRIEMVVGRINASEDVSAKRNYY
jgi:hypothetical protein